MKALVIMWKSHLLVWQTHLFTKLMVVSRSLHTVAYCNVAQLLSVLRNDITACQDADLCYAFSMKKNAKSVVLHMYEGWEISSILFSFLRPWLLHLVIGISTRAVHISRACYFNKILPFLFQNQSKPRNVKWCLTMLLKMKMSWISQLDRPLTSSKRFVEWRWFFCPSLKVSWWEIEMLPPSQSSGVVKIEKRKICISRISDQNGISRLYNILEIYHSGPVPLIYIFF